MLYQKKLSCNVAKAPFYTLWRITSSKGYQGTTRGTEQIFTTSGGIKTRTSGLNQPLLCRLSYEVEQKKLTTINVANRCEEKVRVHINVVPRSTMNTNRSDVWIEGISEKPTKNWPGVSVWLVNVPFFYVQPELFPQRFALPLSFAGNFVIG